MSTPSHFSLLVIDDEPDLRTLYELTLLREGYDIETAGSVQDGLAHLKDRVYSAVITDMRLPDGTGLDLLKWLEVNGRREKAVVITAYGSAENAVEALKAGAYDYLTKPVDLKQFRSVVASALGLTAATVPQVVPANLPSGLPGSPKTASTAPAARAPRVPSMGSPATATAPTATLPTPPASRALERMAGQSGAMQQVRSLVDKVARSMAPVLVNGESGTGKELVARAIHEVSARAAQPFVAVNCSAIPEQLLEAEFFGYRKGAFTGAAEDREGFFQAADGGTLFLDEIGDLPLSMQSKLLRAIQERSVRPVGAVAEVPVNVRLLSATHKDLNAEVLAGRFRQDLYYRLNVIQVRVPPLRERLEDLAAIASAVLDRIAADGRASARVASRADAPRHGAEPVPATTPYLTRDALVHLARYEFPGNVRELENLLHRAVALSGREAIDVHDLGLPDTVFTDSAAQELAHVDDGGTRSPLTSPSPASTPAQPAEAPLPADLEAYLDDVERDILVRALEHHRFNRTAAGASLGLSLRQMRYRMARLSITVGGGDTVFDSDRGL